MKSSAKVLFSLFAMSALGAVGFACTVGSGTVDDVDGGTSTSSSSSSSSSGSSGSTSSSSGAVECPAYLGARTEDGGAGGAPIFQPQECQSCLFTNCCAETAGCFNTQNEPVDGGKVGCVDYTECVVTCESNETTQEAIDQCVKDFCDSTTFAETPAAYKTFRGCRDTKCTMCP